jgi:diaminopimelate epimerase
MPTNALPYYKMNGLGNEILVVDLRAGAHLLTAVQVEAIAAVPTLKFDQLMALHKAKAGSSVAAIKIYNNDGSLAGACGNGMRCVALAESRRTGQSALTFETAAGLLAATIDSPASISVDMGTPRFDWQDIPLSEPFADTRYIELNYGPDGAPILHSPAVVNVGNPHAVFWVENVHAYDLGRMGPMLENHPLFPERANISLARITSPNTLTLRTWERGAGLTQACGSAACAAVVCAARLKRTERTVTVTLPGGLLDITWTRDDRIVMTGPAEMEHEGLIDLATLTVTQREVAR